MKNDLTSTISNYWNEHIHDLAIAKHPVGSEGFFNDLEDYRFEKLDYLPRVVDFSRYRGKSVLEIGCGVGLDLVRFASGGAKVSGVDCAQQSIELARRLFSQRGLEADLRVMDGEALDYRESTFDLVYAHGVIQYTANPGNMVSEMQRVLKPGGEAIAMLYNRRSWLNLLSKVMNVTLEHEDAPVLRRYSIAETRDLFRGFSSVRIVPERFPVKTRLHRGWKGTAYNGVFVPLFHVLPRILVRRWGWHIMIFARK
jgi:2-polyprenyl-3-methyl-5-hydroxy-6-metoxy-1,4-benzoquinol methylase